MKGVAEHKKINSVKEGCCGAVLLEFAMIAPLILLSLFASIGLSFLMAEKNIGQAAASMAARVAAHKAGQVDFEGLGEFSGQQVRFSWGGDTIEVGNPLEGQCLATLKEFLERAVGAGINKWSGICNLDVETFEGFTFYSVRATSVRDGDFMGSLLSFLGFNLEEVQVSAEFLVERQTWEAPE